MVSTSIDRADGLSSSTALKGPCRCATTANIALAGLQTIDSVSLASGDRVLVKNQTNAADNGIWIAAVGAWTRARDFSLSRDIRKGTSVNVTDGTTNGGAWWTCATENSIVVGSTSLAFSQLFGDQVALAQAAADDAEAALAAILALDYVEQSEVGAANGVAPLDSDSKVPLAYLPSLSSNSVFDTRALVAAATIAGSANQITTLGHTAANDGGGGLYKRVGSEPSHAGKIQSADGAWWELDTVRPTAAMFGAFASGSGAANATALANAAGYLTAKSLTRLVVDEALTVSGASRTALADVTFVGRGSLTSVYRKTVIRETAPSPSFSFDGDILPGRHLKKTNSKHKPVFVIIGDSTTVNSLGASRQDMIYGVLKQRIMESFAGRSPTVYNRAVGGSVLAEVDDNPSSATLQTMPWYGGVTTKTWRDYVKDLNPDCVIVNFGQNDGASMSASVLKAFYDYTQAWTNVPDFILCTASSPALQSGVYTDATHLERDLAAGMARSFAQYYGLGLIDINRAVCLARDGFDPRRAAIKATGVTVSASVAGTNLLSAQAGGQWGLHYGSHRVRARFNASAWATGDYLLFRFGGGSGADYVQVGKTVGGNLDYSYSAGNSGDLVTLATNVDTGIAAPTSATADLWAEVDDGVFRLYKSNNFVEPAIEVQLWGYGNLNKPAYVFSVGPSVILAEAEFWGCVYETCMPTLTDSELYNTAEFNNDNGINHASGLGIMRTAEEVLKRTQFATARLPNVIFDSSVIVGTPASTAITDLAVKTIPAGEVKAGDVIEVIALGTWGGAASSKTLTLYLGAQVLLSVTNTLNSGAWEIKSRLKVLSATNSYRGVTELLTTAVALTRVNNTTTDFASAQDVKVQGTGSGTLNDIVLQDFMVRIVETA